MRQFLSDYPIVGVLSGLAMFVWPWWAERQGREGHARRIAELDAGADEAFFEERRALEAYPPLRATGLRVAGAFFALLGLALILLDSQR